MKLIRKHVVGVICLLLLSACGKNEMNFMFTDQDGNSFGSEDLHGEVWVANFIFTNCETVCPPMTAHMAKLQQMLEDEGLHAEFVSFSVDPEVDTPEALKAYASKFEANFSNWHFLTGYTQAEIEEFAKNNFATLVQKPSGNDQVIHGTKFYLVDQSGKIAGEFDGVSDTPYEEIIQQIKKLK